MRNRVSGAGGRGAQEDKAQLMEQREALQRKVEMLQKRERELLEHLVKAQKSKK